MNNKVEEKLIQLSKSRNNVLIPLFVNAILGITLIVLTAQQSREINNGKSSNLFGASLGGWYRQVCQNRIVGSILSPFSFNFKIDVFNAEIGVMGCPWRVKNTIYRLITVCFIVIITLYQIVCLLYKQKSKIWKLLYWFEYVLYLAMIIILIMDCDGCWNGYSACINNFDMETGNGPIILNLLAVMWQTTQSPSWCLGAVNDNIGVVKQSNFKIVDGCYLTPYIYTALCDAGLIIFTWLSYRLASLYIFDDDDNDNRYDDDDGNNKNRSITIKSKSKSSKQKRRRGLDTNHRRSKTTPNPHRTTTRGGSTTRGNVTRKTSLSWIEPAHWKSKPSRSGHHIVAPSPAYQVTKSPTYIPSMPIKHDDGSMQEPAHWNINRKPTYERNYS